MAAPTLATNAGATILRVPDGTSGDSVAGNDIWDWDDGGGSDNGDGDVPKDGGGTVKVDTFIDETVEDGEYTIKAGKTIQFGNSSTASYFKMTSESWWGEAGALITVTTNAVLVMDNSFVNLAPDATMYVIANGETGTFIMQKGAGLKIRSNFEVRFYSGTVDFSRCSLTHNDKTNTNCYFRFYTNLTQKYNDVLFENIATIRFGSTPDEMNNVRVNNTRDGVVFTANATLRNILVTNYTNYDYYANGGITGTVLNPLSAVKAPYCADATSKIIEKQTCDIRVSDPNGAGLEGVTVTCNDEADSEVFSVTTTDGLQVTGALDPNIVGDMVNIGAVDASGAYNPANPDPEVYKITLPNGAIFYLWHKSTATERWRISHVVGSIIGSISWVKNYVAGDPIGDYTAEGNSSGTATVAAISGLIPQQLIEKTRFTGTDETEAPKNPHQFIFSIADYPDMTWKGIIVDDEIDWEVGMGGMSNKFQLEDINYRLEDG